MKYHKRPIHDLITTVIFLFLPLKLKQEVIATRFGIEHKGIIVDLVRLEKVWEYIVLFDGSTVFGTYHFPIKCYGKLISERI
ncbi:MAG TPA: hypothetical protein VIK86_07795 [Candidatus Paceibacterota bacterium]